MAAVAMTTATIPFGKPEMLFTENQTIFTQDSMAPSEVREVSVKYRWYRTIATQSKTIELLIPACKVPIDLHYIGQDANVDAFESRDVITPCAVHSGARLIIDQVEYHLEQFDVKHYSFEIHLYIDEDDQVDADQFDNFVLQLDRITVDGDDERERFPDEADDRQQQQPINHVTSDEDENSDGNRKMDDVIVEDDRANSMRRKVSAGYSSSQSQQATRPRPTLVNESSTSGTHVDSTSGGRRLSRLESLLRQQIAGTDATSPSNAGRENGARSSEQRQVSMDRSPSGPRYDWLGTGLEELRSSAQHYDDSPVRDSTMAAVVNGSQSFSSPSTQRRPNSVDRASSSTISADRRAPSDGRPPSGQIPSASLPRPLDTSTPLLSRSRSVESVVSSSAVVSSSTAADSGVDRGMVGTRPGGDGFHYQPMQRLLTRDVQQQNERVASLPTPINGSVSGSVANVTVDDEDLTMTLYADRKEELAERTIVNLSGGGDIYSLTKEIERAAGHQGQGQRGGQHAMTVRSPLVTGRTSLLYQSSVPPRAVRHSSPVVYAIAKEASSSSNWNGAGHVIGTRVADIDDTVTSLRRTILERDRQIDELRQSNSNLQRLIQRSRSPADVIEVGTRGGAVQMTSSVTRDQEEHVTSELTSLRKKLDELERQLADMQDINVDLTANLAHAEQKMSSLALENESLRSTKGRRLQQLEEENNLLREQLRRIQTGQSGQFPNSVADGSRSLYDEVRELRDELHNLRDDNQRLVHGNRLLVQRIEGEWKKTSGDLRRTKTDFLNENSMNSDHTSATIVSQKNITNQNVNNWLNDKHHALATVENGVRNQQIVSGAAWYDSLDKTSAQSQSQQHQPPQLTRQQHQHQQLWQIDLSSRTEDIADKYSPPFDPRSHPTNKTTGFQNSSRTAKNVSNVGCDYPPETTNHGSRSAERERKLSSSTDRLLEELPSSGDDAVHDVGRPLSLEQQYRDRRCASADRTTKRGDGQVNVRDDDAVQQLGALRATPYVESSPPTDYQSSMIGGTNQIEAVVSMNQQLQSTRRETLQPSVVVNPKRLSISSTSTESILLEADWMLNNVRQKQTRTTQPPSTTSMTSQLPMASISEISRHQQSVENRSPIGNLEHLGVEPGRVQPLRAVNRTLTPEHPSSTGHDYLGTKPASNLPAVPVDIKMNSEFSASRENTSSINAKRPFAPRSPNEITVGDVVKFLRQGGKISKGQVKYVGRLPAKNDIYLGVELEHEMGKHDGVFNGQRIFHCQPNRGVFVAFSKVIMAWSD